MSFDIIIIVVFFITIHLLANKIIPSEHFKRLRWLSFSVGLAVSYVFVYVLPSLHKEQQKLKDYSSTLAMESELYVIGLLGLLLFYALEKSLSFAQLKGSAEKNTFFLAPNWFLHFIQYAYFLYCRRIERRRYSSRILWGGNWSTLYRSC